MRVPRIMLKKPDKKTRRRVKETAVAAVAAGSMFFSGLFAAPSDLLDTDSDPSIAIVEMVTDGGADGDAAVDAADENAESDEEKNRRGGFRAKLRQWILQLPFGLRLMFGVPIWCFGWGLCGVFNALWSVVLSPVASRVLFWVLMAAALIGAFAFTVKTVFPDVPLKKLMNRRVILWFLLGAAGLGVLDSLLPLFWADYEKISVLLRAAGSCGLFMGVGVPFAVRLNRKRQQA